MSIMKNMAIADLRTINTVEAAHSIEEMTNIGTIILPENGDPEVMAIIAAIPKKNVGNTITLPMDAKVVQMTGEIQFTAAILQKEGLILATGDCIVPEPVAECNAELHVTGNLIYPKTSAIKINSMTGNSKALDYEHYIGFRDNFELDAATLEMADYKTLFKIDGDMKISKDVSLELLKEKLPFFLVDGDVRCQKEVAPFFKLRAEIDGDLRVKGPRYDEDEDDD